MSWIGFLGAAILIALILRNPYPRSAAKQRRYEDTWKRYPAVPGILAAAPLSLILIGVGAPWPLVFGLGTAVWALFTSAWLWRRRVDPRDSNATQVGGEP